MQKKNIDTIVGIQEYNNKLFKKSGQLTLQCKKIDIEQVSSFHRDLEIKKKYNTIQDKLQNVLKMLRNFTNTEKPTFNNPIDLANQILQETKLQVQIQFRKAQQQKNTLKTSKKQLNAKKQRPQDKHPAIRPYQNFDQHIHQSYIQDRLIPKLKPCEQVKNPSDIKNECLYVDTVQKLDQAIKQMKQYSQLAVDVEHSTKSYQGFTCLIQISTRSKDYIIDVFPLWAQVPALQQVIGNPNILKVMHGAQMDTKWLQRDFNIHIINLFDTHKASRVLGLEKFSYAYSLNKYFSVAANKVYQRADWRERPLSPQMLNYARQDTHYLLGIYDHMRIDLQKQAKQINLSINDILRDIHRSSHQVTLANAELFSYKNKQIYMNLQIQFKNKPQFQIVQCIFSEINAVAYQLDQNFDDIITRGGLTKALLLTKQMALNNKSNLSKQKRIEKLLAIIQKANEQHLRKVLPTIKNVLYKVFCKKNIVNQQKIDKQFVKGLQKKVEQQKQTLKKITINNIDEQPVRLFERKSEISVKFVQLKISSFHIDQNKYRRTQNQRSAKLTFKPFSSFLSQKYGVEQKKQQEENQIMNQQQSDQQDQYLNNQQNQSEQKEDQKDCHIEFKRMNPNVIYAIQAADPQIQNALKTQKPRKVKKQSEYENRIKNKTGNIFDLLGSN